MSRDLHSEVQAGLRALADTFLVGSAGLAADLPAGVDADRLALVLGLVGDGLRLEVELPRAILRWLEGRARDERRVVLDAGRDALMAQALPPSNEPDERLELAVQARDEAESLLVATRRIERADAWEAPGFAELDEVCGAFDTAVERFGREAVERALGPRAEMLGPGHWASRLPERERTEDPGLPEIPRGRGLPSDEAVRAFVQDGRHHRTVLGLAEADPSFAEQVHELIDVLRASEEHVGLAARRWAHARSASASSPAATIAFPIGLRRAAADASDTQAILEDLGHLVAVDANAHLVIERGEVTLELEAGEELTEVRFGGVAATLREGLWTARVPFARSVALVVRAPDGRGLDVTLDLEATS